LYKITTLDNNLRVITNAMPATRSVSICVFIGVGSRYEENSEAGISHYVEHLCFKGTDKRATSREIAAAIEGVGGIFNGGTDKEFTIYWSKVAASHFRHAVDVLIDMVLHSRYENEDIEKERQVIIEEINMSKDLPQQQVGILIDNLLWPNHPMGRDIIGSKESVSAINRDMILDFTGNRYVCGDIVISIAGNIQHDEVISTINDILGHHKTKDRSSRYVDYLEQKNPKMAIEKRDTEQTHLCLALPGLSRRHPDRYTLDLLNVILGEGMSSRLFIEVRDKMALAYDIHSYVEHFHDTGSFSIYAGVEPGNLGVAVKAIAEQLALLKEPIFEEELLKAKELSRGRMLLRMEDSRNVASWFGAQEILNREIYTVEEIESIIKAVTIDDIMRVARELLVSEKLRLAVVGPVRNEDRLAGLLKI